MNINTSLLPPVSGLRKVNASDALNADIIHAIHLAYPKAVKQVAHFARQFKGATDYHTASNIWHWVKAHIPYKKDSELSQIIKMPTVAVRDAEKGIGTDCKSFSLLSAALLGANGLPVAFRYAGYSRYGSTPTHVYVVTGNTIVDGVFSRFNDQKEPEFFKDYKMEVVTLSGLGTLAAAPQMSYPDKLKRLLAQHPKQNSVVASLVAKELNKTTGSSIHTFYASHTQIDQYKAALARVVARNHTKSIVYKLATQELEAINSGRHDGVIAGIGKAGKGKKFFKKLGKLAKKAALQPIRAAFLSLALINFAGVAVKLARLKKENPDKYKKFWDKWGGDQKFLDKAVNGGVKLHDKLHKKKALKGYDDYNPVNGPESDYNPPMQGIGAAPVVAAAIAAATPILLYVVKLVGGKKTEGMPEISAHDAAMSAADLAEAAGVPKEDVEAMRKAAEKLPDDVPAITDPTQMEITDRGKDSFQSGFSMSPILLVGLAAAAFMMFKGKK